MTPEATTYALATGDEYEIAPPYSDLWPDMAPCDAVFVHPAQGPLLARVWDGDREYAWANLAANPAYPEQPKEPFIPAPADWPTRIVRQLPGLPF